MAKAKKDRLRRTGKIDLRMEILTRLRHIGKSVYWLSKEQTVVYEGTVRQYLHGYRQTTGDVIGSLMEIVGLHVVANDKDSGQ